MCNCKKDKSCCKDVTKTSKGERGKTGPQGIGQTGPIGLTGPQGLAGSNGANGINGTNGLQGIQGIQGPAGSSTMPMDTNWKDLVGFGHYSVGATKPQCRRIGNVIYFRGIVVVPLATTITSPAVIPLNGFAGYEGQIYSATYTGVGGCSLPSGTPGLVQFNLGQNCIPVSVTAALTQLDGDYVQKNIIATRDINIGVTPATTAVTLSTVVSIGMTAGKNLYIQTLEDLEFTNNRPTNPAQSSPLHFISSNVALNDYIPNYRITTPVHLTTETNLHASPPSVGAGTHNIKALYATQYPFAVNLGNSKTIGGLQIQLDGFHVFLSTCNTETGFQYIC